MSLAFLLGLAAAAEVVEEVEFGDAGWTFLVGGQRVNIPGPTYNSSLPYTFDGPTLTLRRTTMKAICGLEFESVDNQTIVLDATWDNSDSLVPVVLRGREFRISTKSRIIPFSVTGAEDVRVAADGLRQVEFLGVWTLGSGQTTVFDSTGGEVVLVSAELSDKTRLTAVAPGSVESVSVSASASAAVSQFTITESLRLAKGAHLSLENGKLTGDVSIEGDLTQLENAAVMADSKSLFNPGDVIVKYAHEGLKAADIATGNSLVVCAETRTTVRFEPAEILFPDEEKKLVVETVEHRENGLTCVYASKSVIDDEDTKASHRNDRLWIALGVCLGLVIIVIIVVVSVLLHKKEVRDHGFMNDPLNNPDLDELPHI